MEQLIGRGADEQRLCVAAGEVVRADHQLRDLNLAHARVDAHCLRPVGLSQRLVAQVPVHQDEVVIPWAGAVRYKARKNGYYGGASLQEMIVPVMMLHAGAKTPAGWQAAPFHEPAWWQGDLRPVSVPTTKATELATEKHRQTGDTQAELLLRLETSP